MTTIEIVKFVLTILAQALWAYNCYFFYKRGISKGYSEGVMEQVKRCEEAAHSRISQFPNRGLFIVPGVGEFKTFEEAAFAAFRDEQENKKADLH